ncbi:MAG: TrmB family transcriptional regulator [Nitrososphaerales archaeon]
MVRGEFNILSKIYEMLERSQKELLITIPFITNGMADFFSNRLMGLSRKGVKITVMTTKATENRALKKLSLAEVRVRDKMFGGGIISDGREAILLLGEEREGKLDSAIWSDHIGLAKFAKNYFEYLWNSSEKVMKP